MATYRNVFIVLTFIAMSCVALALLTGNSTVSAIELFHALVGQGNALSHEIVFLIRLPRVLTAFITGGLLALAGCIMQVIVRNPLADPYVLGISGGAAVTTLLLMLLGCSSYDLTLGAWAGSLATILLVFLLTRRNNGWNSQQLLLTGIALASGFSALISLILIMSPDRTLRSMLFWLMGDLSYARIPLFEGGILVVGLALSWCYAKELNILIRGEHEATALGVNTQRLQWKLYLLGSLLTATAVTLAGCIGFIGLIIPHIFRLLFGYDHRFLLPGCVLLGGSVLTLADMLSRTLFFPETLPVGIMMALIGIPIFLFLLQKNSI